MIQHSSFRGISQQAIMTGTEAFKLKLTTAKYHQDGKFNACSVKIYLDEGKFVEASVSNYSATTNPKTCGLDRFSSLTRCSPRLYFSADRSAYDNSNVPQQTERKLGMSESACSVTVNKSAYDRLLGTELTASREVVFLKPPRFVSHSWSVQVGWKEWRLGQGQSRPCHNLDVLLKRQPGLNTVITDMKD